MSAISALTWESISSRVSQLLCGLGGHELLLHAEPGRLSLRCMSCPYETPGWTIKEKAAEARPHREGRGVLIQQPAR